MYNAFTPDAGGSNDAMESIALEAQPVKPFIREICEATANYYRIPLERLLSRSHKREFSRPRQVAMFLSRKMTSNSFQEIGRRIGNRDHSTVVHAHEQIGALAKIDPEIAHAVELVSTRALAMAASRVPAPTIQLEQEGNSHV